MTQQHGAAGNHRYRQQHLQTAKAKQFGAQFPQHGRFQFEPDKEQHDDHAKFGNVLHIVRFRADEMKYRADEDACQQITQHRAETKPF